MKHRFFEVVLFAIGILSTTALLVTIAFIPFFYMAVSIEDTILLIVSCVTIVAVILSFMWILNYIIRGEKYSFYDVINLVFGKVPKYFLFIGSILTIGGIITAVYRGTSDESIWWSDFSEGVGAALAVLTLGLLGRLYSGNRFLGHVILTLAIGLISIIFLP